MLPSEKDSGTVWIGKAVQDHRETRWCWCDGHTHLNVHQQNPPWIHLQAKCKRQVSREATKKPLCVGWNAIDFPVGGIKRVARASATALPEAQHPERQGYGRIQGLAQHRHQGSSYAHRPACPHQEKQKKRNKKCSKGRNGKWNQRDLVALAGLANLGLGSWHSTFCQTMSKYINILYA